jgi:hypothetical protein
MYCMFVNVYCHRVTTQLQLIDIPYQPKFDFSSHAISEFRVCSFVNVIFVRFTYVHRSYGKTPQDILAKPYHCKPNPITSMNIG